MYFFGIEKGTQKYTPNHLGGGGREAQEGGDIHILMADSRCMAETNTTL